MKYNFTDKDTFARLEEKAIDGQLDYSAFPPAEYRYFSQLARLGYLNRHRGWTAQLCEIKQKEHRKAYDAAVAERDEWLNHARRIQRRLIRTTELSRRLNFAKTRREALPLALELIEVLVEEPDLAERIMHNLKEEYE
jgi:hypothetical protein